MELLKTIATNLDILGWISIVLFVGGVALIIVAIVMIIKEV
jgi:NADH:ubiquinone oxidoreductase subunit 6 (subunit J)